MLNTVLCVCVCVCVRARACVCMCVCVAGAEGASVGRRGRVGLCHQEEALHMVSPDAVNVAQHRAI